MPRTKRKFKPNKNSQKLINLFNSGNFVAELLTNHYPSNTVAELRQKISTLKYSHSSYLNYNQDWKCPNNNCPHSATSLVGLQNHIPKCPNDGMLTMDRFLIKRRKKRA
eukprot:459386_1